MDEIHVANVETIGFFCSDSAFRHPELEAVGRIKSCHLYGAIQENNEQQP